MSAAEKRDAFRWYEGAWAAPVEHYTDRLVLLAIAKHADKNGIAFPSQRRIALECAATERTIWASLKRLRAAGYVHAQKRYGKSSIYQLHLYKMCGKHPAEFAEMGDQQSRNNCGTVPQEMRHGSAPDAEELSKELSNELSTLSETRDECREVFDHFNAVLVQLGKQPCSKLTAKRRTQLRARLRDDGLQAIKKAIDRIPDSAFLRGDTGNWDVADFDFLIRPDSVTKILEGRYADRKHRPAPHSKNGFMASAMSDACVAPEPSHHSERGQALLFDHSRQEQG